MYEIFKSWLLEKIDNLSCKLVGLEQSEFNEDGKRSFTVDIDTQEFVGRITIYEPNECFIEMLSMTTGESVIELYYILRECDEPDDIFYGFFGYLVE